MKFGTYFENNQISEWRDFYINYEILKSLLKPLQRNYKEQVKKIVFKKSSMKKASIDIEDSKDLLEEALLPIDSSREEHIVSREEALEYQIQFKDQIIREFKKVEFFIQQNFRYYINRSVKIVEQLEYIKQNKQYKAYNDNLEEALKQLYKEINLMKGYIELNFKAKSKILKKFKKVTKYLDSNIKINVESELNSLFEYSNYLNDPVKKLTEIITDCEKTFYLHFFDKYTVSTMKVLREYITEHTFTQTQSFYLGFFVGILLVSIFLCYLIASNFHIDMDSDVDFSSIIPMFRGFGIICMYMWILGLNVWAWNTAHIDYKLCFYFKSHFSDVMSIFKRAAIFSSILVLMILIYLIQRTEIPIVYDLVSFIPLKITPLICWVSLIIYLASPFKNTFNYPGRVFFYTLLYESFASIYIKTEFRHIWFMDQLTSLIGPMRDIEYTMCYYAYYDTPFTLRKELCTNTRGIVLVIGVLPHFIRILQCIRVMYDSKSFFPQIVNAGKYFFAILVAVFSFLLIINPIFHTLWWVFAIFSAIYSSYWDIKYDFGFLQPGPNYPLRDKLSYKNKFFYYFTMVTDLFLRFVWMVSVSPEVISGYIRPEFLSLLIFSLEAFRRGMWNFIRVELQHIQLCKEFKVTVDVELPFKKVNGRFELKNVDVVDLVKMNRRLEKIKSMRSVNMNLLKEKIGDSLLNVVGKHPSIMRRGKIYK
jgi:hypothetical protein